MLINTATFPLQDSLVVQNPDRQRLHLLTPSARTIYEALTAGLLPDEIVQEIARVTGAGPHSVRRKLDSLLQQWSLEGLTAESTVSPEQEKSTEERQLCEYGIEPKDIYDEADFHLDDLVFRVRTEDTEIWMTVLKLYGHLKTFSEHNAPETIFSLYSTDKTYLLVQDNLILKKTDCRDEIILALASEIAELWHRRRDWLFIAHAAGLYRRYTCMILPAKGGSGKTTLAAALLKHGFSFLSDDILPVLKSSGNAVAHQLCLHIKQGSVDTLRPMYPHIDRLHAYTWGATTLRFLPPYASCPPPNQKSWPIAQIIFPQFQKGADTQFSPVTPAYAFQHLLEAECIIKTPLQSNRVQELIDWVQQRPAYTLRYSSLNEAVEILKNLPDAL